MKLSDKLICGREFVLDRLSGAGPTLVLNAQMAKGSKEHSADPAATVKRALQVLKAGAHSLYAIRDTIGA